MLSSYGKKKHSLKSPLTFSILHIVFINTFFNIFVFFFHVYMVTIVIIISELFIGYNQC